MSDDKTAELARAIDTLRSRRAVLRGAATVGLAGICAPLLAACGGSDDAGGTPTSGGTTTAPTSAPTSAPSSAPSSSAPPSGGPVLGPVSDVPVGGGKVFTDAKVVVTQPTAGQYKGFSAVCTHQQNPVGSVSDGQIICPFHQSRFSIADGSVVSGPATQPLPSIDVTVQGGNILGPA